MRLSREGAEYFVYLPTKKTCWCDPRGLEEGASMCLDTRGRVYFQNHKTQTTMWEDPRENPPREQNPTTAEEVKRQRKAEYRLWWQDQVSRHLLREEAERVQSQSEKCIQDLEARGALLNVDDGGAGAGAASGTQNRSGEGGAGGGVFEGALGP